MLRSPRFTRTVGTSVLVVDGLTLRAAATTPATAQRTTATTDHVIALRILIWTALLLQHRIAQRYLFSRLHALREHDLVTASASDVNGAFFKLASAPHIHNVVAGFLKERLSGDDDRIRN